MDIYKIGIIGIGAVIICAVLKEQKGNFALYVSMVACLFISFYIIGKLEIILDTVDVIQGYITVNKSFMTTLFKMIGITYIADFSAGLCTDFGYKSVAGQIEMFGKISVLALSMPILIALMDTIEGFLS